MARGCNRARRQDRLYHHDQRRQKQVQPESGRHPHAGGSDQTERDRIAAAGEPLRAHQQPGSQSHHGGQPEDRVVDPLVGEDEGEEGQKSRGRQRHPWGETAVRRSIVGVCAEEPRQQSGCQAGSADQQQRQQPQVHKRRRIRARTEEPDQGRCNDKVEGGLAVAGGDDARNPVERWMRQDVSDAERTYKVDRRIRDGVAVVLPQPDDRSYRLKEP